MKQYPETLHAVASKERTTWNVAHALYHEAASLEECTAVAEYLAQAGFPSYSKSRLRTFWQMAEFAAHPNEWTSFTEWPFEWVVEAHRAAGGDVEQASHLVLHASSKREIRASGGGKVDRVRPKSLREVQEAIAALPASERGKVAYDLVLDKEAQQERHELVKANMPTYGIGEDEKTVLDVGGLLDAARGRDALGDAIEEAALELRALLARVPEHLEIHGSFRLPESDVTHADILLERLAALQLEVSLAFEKVDGLDAGLSRLLAGR